MNAADFNFRQPESYSRLVFESLPADWATTAPPKRPHVIAPYVPLRAVSGLVSPGNLGKSTLLAEAALYVAVGWPWRGHAVIQGDVVILTWEDMTSDYHAKMFAHIKAHPELLPHADSIRARLHIAPMQTFSYHLVEAMRPDGALVTGLAEATSRKIKARFPKVVWVIVETASRANAAGEDNVGMARLVEAGEVIAHGLNVGVTISHHVNKNAIRQGAIDATASRGGSALVDNCRATSLLVPLDTSSPAELLPPGVKGSDLSGHDAVALVSARSSHARKSDKLWLERKFTAEDLPYFDELRIDVGARLSKAQAIDDRFLAFLKDRMGADWHSERRITRDWKDEHELTERTAQASLERLHRAGFVEQKEGPQYGDKGKNVTSYRLKPAP